MHDLSRDYGSLNNNRDEPLDHMRDVQVPSLMLIYYRSVFVGIDIQLEHSSLD